ncbi:MAG: hypothetical protein IAE91_03060 [Ignavibacteriaceae bacterium]|nr:hypothetical protein [Ignavibacteriaceae bacterium]
MLKTLKIAFPLAILSLLLFQACDNKNGNRFPISPELIENNSELVTYGKRIYGNSIATASRGYFRNMEEEDIVFGQEVMNKNDWGIKFILTELEGDTLSEVYSTQLLEGSLKKNSILTVSVNTLGRDLLYYDSRDFFLGNSGGEVFIYLFDFKSQIIYKGHLYILDDGIPNLFLNGYSRNNFADTIITEKMTAMFPELKKTQSDFRFEY